MLPRTRQPRGTGRLLALILLFSVSGFAQASSDDSKTLQERLGYPADARLLIIHTDDIGVAHSVNAATVAGMEHGLVNSGSIMVPCPWFPEFAAYARNHPELDLGLHLTLTSEWKHYRWGPVLPAARVPTLVEENGFLRPTAAEAAAHMDPAEVEAELHAQVERALAFGVRPTHLDSHMGTLFQTPALFEAYLRVGRAYGLPVHVPREQARVWNPAFMDQLGPDDIVIDRFFIAETPLRAEDWGDFYTDIIETLPPGISQILIHLGYDDAELQAVMVDHPDWGAAWRQRDFDYFTDPGLAAVLEANNVHLVTWREIGSLLKRETAPGLTGAD